jgi:hypothetical protein
MHAECFQVIFSLYMILVLEIRIPIHLEGRVASVQQNALSSQVMIEYVW